MLSFGMGERGSGTALADDEDIVLVCVGLNHGQFGARLRSDNNFYAAPVEILNGVERL